MVQRYVDLTSSRSHQPYESMKLALNCSLENNRKRCAGRYFPSFNNKINDNDGKKTVKKVNPICLKIYRVHPIKINLHFISMLIVITCM